MGAASTWDHLKIGEHVDLEVTNFCEPCRRISQCFHRGNYNRINQEQYPGWSRLYARVISEGQVRQGDPIWIETLSEGAMS